MPPLVIPENFGAERRNLSGSRSTAFPLGSTFCSLFGLCLSFDSVCHSRPDVVIPDLIGNLTLISYLYFYIKEMDSRVRGNDRGDRKWLPAPDQVEDDIPTRE